MKKLNTLAVILACAVTAYGQKPESGTFTTQVAFSLATLMPNVSSFGVNGRYFLNEGLAARISLGVDNMKTVENFTENPDGTGKTGSLTEKNNSLGVALGLEKHFAGTDRLSPYAGLQIGFGSGKNTRAGENTSPNGDAFQDDTELTEEAPVSNFGFGLFLGFDYWITDGLYMGAEYSILDIMSFKEKESSMEFRAGNLTGKSTSPEHKTNTISTFGAIPTIRLGWMF